MQRAVCSIAHGSSSTAWNHTGVTLLLLVLHVALYALPATGVAMLQPS
jgi:hypothetical protein